MELVKVDVLLNEQRVLQSINFSWEKGDSIALVGANGAGKTTLLKVISLLLKPTSGEVLLPELSGREWKQRLGLVFPDSFLYEDLTAYENLLFYQKLYGKKDVEYIEKLLETVQLLSVKNEFVSAFSKGMKQRLSIARALVHKPDYLILDEPFDGLDISSKKVLEELLLESKKQGIGYLLVSHDVEHAFILCDEVILLNKGTIIHQQECSVERYNDFLDRYSKLLNGEII